MILALSLLIFASNPHTSLQQPAQPFDQCIDRPYFYYKCSQLSKYCKYPQAFRIRKSCPITCGVCSPNQGFANLNLNAANLNSIHNNLIDEEHQLQPVVPVRDRSVWMERAANQIAERNLDKFGQSLVPVASPPPPIFRPTPALPVFTPKPNRLQPLTPFNTRTSTTIKVTIASSTPAPVVLSTTAENIPEFVKLTVPPTTLSGPLNDVQADQELLRCCKRNLISAYCEPLCSYKTSKSDILKRAVSGSCTIEDAKLWVKCAAGGNRNEGCCRKQRVRRCNDMCNGQFPGNFNGLLTCVNSHLPKILSCHRDAITAEGLAAVTFKRNTDN